MTIVLVSGCAGLPRIDPSGRRILIWPEPEANTAPSLPSMGNVDVPPVYAGGGTAVGPPPTAPLGQLTAPQATTALSPAKERLSITPARLLAPVGSEVILKAGVCGDNGYLRTNRRIDWLLGQQGVGQFVTVGEQGEFDILRAPWQRPNKQDNSYAVGYTTPFSVCLRRGNDDATDDVQVERGEAWITLTSPSEGVSYVTATAPESENWDARRSVATIYWVDAQWKIPPPIVLQPGQTGTLTTTVNRQSDGAPIEGWLVRYEVTQGNTARLGYESGQTSEVETDAQGRATVQVTPTDDQPGNAVVRVTIVRPATSGSMPAPRLEVGGGNTSVTWTPTASTPVGPPIVDDDPGTETPAPPAPFEPPPRGDDGDTIGEPEPGIGPRVEIVIDRTTTGPIRPGDPIPVTITLLNTGDEPAQNLSLTAEYDRGLSSPQDPRGEYRLRYPTERLYDLSPGDSNVIDLDFSAVEPGESCCEVTVTGDQMSSAFGRKCFEIESPAPAARPQLRIETALDAVRQVGETMDYIATVYNDGTEAVENVTVEILSTPELEAIAGTEGKRVIDKGLRWEGERIEAGESLRFDVQFECVSPTQEAKVTTYVDVAGTQGVAEKTDAREIRPARRDAAPPTAPRSPLSGVISSSDNPVAVRNSATLNIAITNNSDEPLDNVEYRLRLPASFQTTFLAGATKQGSDLIFAPITRLTAGETFSTSITYTPTEQGVYDLYLDLRVGPDGTPIAESTSVSVTPR